MHGAAEHGVQPVLGNAKKLIEAHRLGDDDGDSYTKCCALIRANLGKDPTTGSAEDFAADYNQALWLENWRLRRTAEMIARILGAKT